MRDYVKYRVYTLPSILRFLKNQQMINVTFTGDISRKSQKLEGFTNMNAS
jgi:hypothetical protein